MDRLDCVITVADAKHIMTRLEEVKPEGVENEAVEQVAFADKILLNKIDLIKDEKGTGQNWNEDTESQPHRGDPAHHTVANQFSANSLNFANISPLGPSCSPSFRTYLGDGTFSNPSTLPPKRAFSSLPTSDDDDDKDIRIREMEFHILLHNIDENDNEDNTNDDVSTKETNTE